MINPEWNWVEFTEAPVRESCRDKIYASLNERGDLLLNRKGYQALGRPEAVVLLVDLQRRAIGIRPAPPETVNALKVNKKGRFDNWIIHAWRFTKKYDMRITGTVRFPTARVEHGVLILELKLRVPITYRPRPGRPHK